LLADGSHDEAGPAWPALASFPDCSHLQFLIACSMPNRGSLVPRRRWGLGMRLNRGGLGEIKGHVHVIR